MSINASAGDIIDKVFENFKKITPALFAVSLLTGLLLFLPKSVLSKMALDNLPDIWKAVIGIQICSRSVVIGFI